MAMVMFFLFILHFHLTNSQPLKGNEDITLLALIDFNFSSRWDEDIFSAINTYVNVASKMFLKDNKISVNLIDDTKGIFGKGEEELPLLLTIIPCSYTWQLYNQHKTDDLLQISITEPNCPRLPSSKALTIPLLKFEEHISQIILDLRTDYIMNWEEAAIIYDDSISSHLPDRLMKILSEEIFIDNKVLPSMSSRIFKLNAVKTEWARRSQIVQLLRKIRTSSKFLCFLEQENVGVTLEMAQTLGLINIENQWIFHIMELRGNISTFASLVSEGGNVAFLYSNIEPIFQKERDGLEYISSTLQNYGRIPNDGRNRENQNVNLLRQEVQHIIFGLLKALKELTDAEKKVFGQVSEEEWETLKPSSLDRLNEILSNLKETLKSGNIFNDEKVVQSICCPTTIHWRATATESWGLNHGEVPNLLDVGDWTPGLGFFFWDYLFPHLHHAFRGKEVKIASFHQPPWQIIYLNEEGGVIGYRGLVFEILDELAKNLNFSYSLYQLSTVTGVYVGSNRKTTSRLSDSNQKNLSLAIKQSIEAVRQKNVMIGAAAFVITAELEGLVNLTSSIAIEKHAFLTSRPQVLSRAFIFIAPFSYDTWICIAVSMLVMGPVLYWVHHYTPYYEYYGLKPKQKHSRKKKRKIFSTQKLSNLDGIWKCTWYVYGALLQQGGIQLPMADSGRIVVGTWWIVVIVVMTTYCGNLVAFLTFPTVASPVSSLEELMEALETPKKGHSEPSITLGIIDEASSTYYFKDAADSRLRYLYTKAKIHDESLQSRSRDRAVLESVSRGRHILIARHSHLLLLSEEDYYRTNSCSFYIGKEKFLEENLAMALAKNSPYLNLINQEIKRMHQSGLIQKWTSDNLPRKNLCKEKAHERHQSDQNRDIDGKSSNREVKLDDMQGSFFLLFIGCFLAILTMFVEYVWNRREKLRECVIKPFLF